MPFFPSAFNPQPSAGSSPPQVRVPVVFSHLRNLFLTPLLILFLMPVSAVFAGQGDVLLNSDTQIRYADDCFAGHDYGAAAAEYKRFIYFFPDDERTSHARFDIGMSLFYLQDYAAALNQFTAIFDRQGLSATGVESAWMISRCYRHTGDYRAAIGNLTYLIRLSSGKTVTDHALADKAWHQIGWLYLESGDFQQARDAFGRISLSGRAGLDMDTLDAQLKG